MASLAAKRGLGEIGARRKQRGNYANYVMQIDQAKSFKSSAWQSGNFFAHLTGEVRRALKNNVPVSAVTISFKVG